VIGTYDPTPEQFKEDYQGTWRTPEEYVEEYISDITDIPDSPKNYIDWVQMAEDFERDGYSFPTGGNGVYVFRSS
jgi:antirestriction protein